MEQKIRSITNAYYLEPVEYTVGKGIFTPYVGEDKNRIICSIEEIYENMYTSNSSVVDPKKMTHKYYVGYDKDHKMLFRFLAHGVNVFYE